MPDLRYVRGWLARYWLACWFGIVTAIRLSSVARGEPGFDARLYLAAARSWLEGGNPWVAIGPQQFAAPPPTLAPLVPFALLPDVPGIASLIALSIAGVVATVRLLHLPWWWVLFPPFIDGAWNGNLHTLVVPLVLAGAGPIAAFVKLYAVVPIALTLRWRALLVTLTALVLTAPLLPWVPYVDHLGELVRTLDRQSDGGFSATALPWVIPVAIGVLGVCGRERAAWLAVPVLWPSTQWYYSSLAVPALVPATRYSMAAAALLAVPLPGLIIVAAISIALQEGNRTWARLRSAWSLRTGPSGP